MDFGTLSAYPCNEPANTQQMILVLACALAAMLVLLLKSNGFMSEFSYTCPHCGGEMTYAAEHRGMTSNCPHCQGEITLGGTVPMAVPTAKPIPAKNGAAKMVVWIAFLLLVIIFAAVAVVLVGRHKLTAKHQESVQPSAAATADVQAVADDVEQFKKTLDEKLGADSPDLVSSNKLLSTTTDAADALRIVNQIIPDFEQAVFMVDNATAPQTGEMKALKKQLVGLLTTEIQRLRKLGSAIESRDEATYSAMLKDGPIHQVEFEQKFSQVFSSMNDILERANRPDAASNIDKANQCISNIRLIEAAKTEWALERKKPNDAVPTETDLLPYLAGNKMPTCPDGGKYTIGNVEDMAHCSLPAHAINP